MDDNRIEIEETDFFEYNEDAMSDVTFRFEDNDDDD